MIQCVDCKRFNLRAEPKMAVVGFGGCTLAPKYEFRSAVYGHDCKHFEAEKTETVAARRAWLDDKRGKT